MCSGGACYITTTAIVLVPVFSVGPVRWPSAVRAGTCCLADSVATCWRSVAHPALDCVYKHQTFKLMSLKIKILFFICTLVSHVYSRKINQMIFFLLYAKHLIIFWLGCTAVFVVVFFLLTTTESSHSGQ